MSIRGLYSYKKKRKKAFTFPVMSVSTVVDFASLHICRLCDCLKADFFKKHLSCFEKPQTVKRKKNPVSDERVLPYNSRVGVGIRTF